MDGGVSASGLAFILTLILVILLFPFYLIYTVIVFFGLLSAFKGASLGSLIVLAFIGSFKSISLIIQAILSG